MPQSENTDLRVAYNGVEWSVGAHVNAQYQAGRWEVNATYQVYAADPYDWEIFDVTTGAATVNTPLGVTQEEIGNLHSAGLAQEYMRFGYTDPEIRTYSIP